MNARDLLRKHGALVAAFLVCVVHFSTFDIGRQPIVTDIRYFLYFSWQVAEGAVPHLDYFENKTALATFAGAGLFRAAEIFRVDPLIAMRVGYLGIASFCGLLLFFVHRTLGGGRAVAGLMGVAAYCSFGLLGILPSIGPIPKLLMALFATAAALLVYSKRWFWAGVCGALAFMDWQIGSLVLVAAGVTGLLLARRRVRAVVHVALGGLAGLAPFALYYLYHGAVSQTVQQVIGASLFRGSEVSARVGFVERLFRIAEVAQRACPSHVWLFYLALPGIAIALWWLWRWRGEDRARLLLPLMIYHGGVIAFSLIDFQGYGDFFLLLHSAVPFVGILWVALYDLALRVTPLPRQRIVAGVALVLVLVLSRPGPLRPEFKLQMRNSVEDLTLEDQREVAELLSRQIGDGRVAFLDHAEALFLMRKKNDLPLVYWNLATWKHYRLSAQESIYSTGLRMALSVDPDAMVSKEQFGFSPFLGRGYDVVTVMSSSGRYGVTLALRRFEEPN
jgi:hypothetical protein